MIYNLIYHVNGAFTETTIRGLQTIYCLIQSKSSRPVIIASRCQATVGADEVKKILDFSSRNPTNFQRGANRCMIHMWGSSSSTSMLLLLLRPPALRLFEMLVFPSTNKCRTHHVFSVLGGPSPTVKCGFYCSWLSEITVEEQRQVTENNKM